MLYVQMYVQRQTVHLYVQRKTARPAGEGKADGGCAQT